MGKKKARLPATYHIGKESQSKIVILARPVIGPFENVILVDT